MLYRKKVVEMEEYKNGKLKLMDGAPQVKTITRQTRIAVRTEEDVRKAE